ncbi:MAG: 3-hydroxyacyl-CoA dehydrogenase family protein [Bacteroidota bacterium]
MNLLVVATDAMKEELLQGAIHEEVYIEWMTGTGGIENTIPFDACLDLLFENSPERIGWLRQVKANLTIVNSVVTPLSAIHEDFIRINGWATFLKRPVMEAAGINESLKEKAEGIFSGLGKRTEWVPDIPGLITARVVASVINEAYFALEEKVSSKEEIDTAMKLGTNYPYGPFEWSEKIGIKNIYTLLGRLAEEQERYEPAALLIKEASA